MATLTVEPNADVAQYHHRMPAILDPTDLDDWFTDGHDQALALLRPAEQGSVLVEPV
jgi:putative SOS response-associated peptidase YedK